MAQVTVAMFNANTVPVTVIVNNGSPLTIGPTSSAIKWRPQVPATAPGFVPGPATPGVIGIGPNSIAITPSGWTTPQLFGFSIPSSAVITSLQVYMYWNQDAGGPCQALFANAGQIFFQCASQSIQAPRGTNDQKG